MSDFGWPSKVSKALSKGQLILKCPFGVFKSPKKQKKSSISALGSKKRSNQKDKGTLKFRYSEKATKISLIFHFLFDIT